MNKRYLMLMLCSATVVHAEGFDPAPVKLGFVDFVPSLTVFEEYDSNLYRQNKDAEESWIQIMVLRMKAQAFDGPHEYTANYRGAAGFFDNTSSDNYIDQSASLGGKWDISTRHRFELQGGYLQDHDRRGTEYFQGDQAQQIDEPARYREEMLLGRYSYGAAGARGRLNFEAKSINRTYLNFREFTRQSDFSNVSGTGTLLWRLVGELQGLVETTYGSVNYKTDPQKQDGINDVRDSNYSAWLTGVTWDVAGKTTGTVKAGYATKDFADRDRKDFGGSSWSGELTWNPVNYSRFSLSTGRRAEESHGRGDYKDVNDWGVAWTHHWTNTIESNLHYRESDETYKADPERRDDKIHRYGIGVDYVMRRWLVFGMFYTREQRDSNIAQFDYPRNFTGLTLRTSF